MMEAPPYARIAADVRRRIAAGELRPGERLPSTRELAARWQVALATATKALAVLKHEGLVRAVPRVGTVVAGGERRAPVRRGARAPSEVDLSRESIVSAAMAIADAEGIAAISMRSVASALGAPPMSLYRHVPSKEDLILAMIDAAFAEVPTCEVPGGWRAHLEAVMRAQWDLYRAHGWLARALSITRPQLIPHGMRHTESVLRAIDGLGLTASEAMHVHVTVMSFVRGSAVGIESELEAEAETGMTRDDWLTRHEPAFAAAFAGGAYPMLARMVDAPDLDLDLDTVFEFGMARLLDGLDRFVDGARLRDRG